MSLVLPEAAVGQLGKDSQPSSRVSSFVFIVHLQYQVIPAMLCPISLTSLQRSKSISELYHVCLTKMSKTDQSHSLGHWGRQVVPFQQL